MSHLENTAAPPDSQDLHSDLEVTSAVLAAIGSEAAAPEEARSPLVIANDLLECMEAELHQIAELRAILLTIWGDPGATSHIKNIASVGINASHFVGKGLEALTLVFKGELAELKPSEQDAGLADADGGDA